MQSSTEALTLTTVKYGDSSLIAACYTKEYGLQSYMLKGILSSRTNKKTPKSLFEPLTLLELEATKNSTDRLGFIKEAKLHYPYQTIPFDLRKKTLLFFLAEVIQQVIKEEQEANDQLYAFLKKRMLWLDTEENVGLFHIKLMLDLSKFIGFYPNISEKTAPYFDLETGCMNTIKPRGSFLDGSIKVAWVQLLGMDFDKVGEMKLSRQEKSVLLDSVVIYFELHLQQFKSPKSTKILNEIFK
ncbi:DNA repair protein RecO [Flavobacteriaceae bacterium]|nr:DNA repair protein RecO [Flavobacteriaceae bacterium]MDC1542983.1 DNA repair protein RecO [Flavobacteriaceae bacterium]